MSFEDKTNVTLLQFQAESIPAQTQVLVLEDCATDRRAMERYAAKTDLDLDFHFVETLEALKDVIETKQFHLAILDYHVPDGTGLEALKVVARSFLNRECATIMIATETEINIAVTAMKSGCSDFILKDDLSPAMLRRTIVNALQKSVLSAKVAEAGRKLVGLRAAVREHSEISSSMMTPMLKRSLAQISALEFLRQQSGQTPTDIRLDIIADNCRDMLKICEAIERDGALATESLSLPPNPA